MARTTTESACGKLRALTEPRRSPPVWMPAIIVAAGIVVYLNSFHGAFLLDDQRHILASEAAQSFSKIWGSRPVVNLTLVLNYKLGGHEVFGYHLVNLLVHLAAALALFGLVRRTLGLRPSPALGARPADGIAFATALLWIVHPLDTQSVTYIIQRGESLMGLFYLLTLYCTLRAAERADDPRAPRAKAGGRALWCAGAVLACALGMATKTVMITAPVLVLLYDRIFLAGSFRACVRRRGWLHAALLATWIVPFTTGVAQHVLSPDVTNKNVGFGSAGLTSIDYALSQPGVILHYLRLAFWPHPLCLDYGWPVARSALAIGGPGLVLAALLGATAWLLWKRPRLGFVMAAFFIVLGPTSSIVPIRDLAFEHRMYLPLAAVILMTVLGARGLIARLVARGMVESAGVPPLVAILLTAAAALLGWRTIDRNKDYQSDVVMWADVVAQRPDNARGRSQYGIALLGDGRPREARPQFEAALALGPDDPVALNNISFWLLAENRIDEAIESMVAAIRTDPAGTARHNLANLIAREGLIDDTIRRYGDTAPLEAVRIEAWIIAGDLHLAEGRSGMALAAYREARTLDPGNAEVTERITRLSSPTPSDR